MIDHSDSSRSSRSSGGSRNVLKSVSGTPGLVGEKQTNLQKRSLVVGDSIFKGIRRRGLLKSVDVNTLRGATLQQVFNRLQKVYKCDNPLWRK